MKRLLAFLILITTGCSSQSSQNTIDKKALPVIESFFKSLSKKNASKALEELLGSNPNINLTDSTTLDLKTKFIYINEASGAYVGDRLLKKRMLEDDIGVYSYLAKYDKKFYRFIFMFYNNGNNVRLYKFLFDDDLDVELEGSLKFYTN